MRMNKKEKTALVPRLRFPEFRESGEWEVKLLGDVTYKVGKKNAKNVAYPIYSINNKEGFLPQSDQFEGMDSNIRGYDISLYKIIERNTFAYNPARINIGSLGYSGELNNIIISSLYVCFKTNKIIDDRFLMCFLSTNNFVQAVKNSVEGGIRNYLFYDNFAKIAVQFPKKQEQQKIADCLSSLDELVTAENKKLKALKAHKKGLMQKLFPAEGENVPEWRFPEFRDSVEWEEEMVKNLVSTVTPPKKLLSSFYKSKGRFPIIDQSQEYICGWTDDQDALVSDELPLIIFGDHTCILKIVNQPFAQGADGIKILLADKCVEPTFLYQYLLFVSVKMESYKRHFSTLKEKAVLFPQKESGEQQKIADCLSSLDDVITAQAQKIEALKTHKKGLMQGLFPSLEEVNI